MTRAAQRVRARDAGETLVELLVSVTIVGSVVAVVIGALTSVVAGATGQRTDARAQAVLTSFAQSAKLTPLIPCATPAEYDARLGVAAGAYTPAVTKVAWWDGSGYRSPQSTLTEAVDGAATSIKVADPAPFLAAGPTTADPSTVKVGNDGTPETMQVTAVSGDTLTVKDRGAAAPAHPAGDGVRLCPPATNRYDLQLLDLAVTGPATGVAGRTGPYQSSISVGKRGPLLIPKLTSATPSPADGTAEAGDTLNTLARLEADGSVPAEIKPTGTITFELFAPESGPGTPTCASTPVFTSAVPVTGFSQPGDSYISDNYVAFLDAGGPRAPGDYHWTATYSGDAAFQGASTACGAPGQTVTVSKKTPMLTAQVPDPPTPPDWLTSDTAADEATLAGGVGPDPDGAGPDHGGPTGKLTFELYKPPAEGDPASEDCAPGNLVYSGDAPLLDPGNGDYHLPGPPADPPPTFADTGPGTYHWTVTYPGDANNASVSILCGDASQIFEVKDPTP